MKERTLHTILDGFQKMELQDLGNILGDNLSPRLRKSQLVDQLHTYLRAQPPGTPPSFPGAGLRGSSADAKGGKPGFFGPPATHS